MNRRLLAALGLVLILILPAATNGPLAPGPARADEPGHTFAETGQAVTGRFWEVWQGGRAYADSLYLNGLPLTDKHAEVSSTDGKIYQVQWFERARFEEHPENARPYDVLLGLLGVRATQGRTEPPFRPVADPRNLPWFPQTQHTLGDTSEGGRAIANFWNTLGGLAQFGYPLSQPFEEVSKDDGKSYLVQYFERQRMEYHPENRGTRYEVLLGRLGAEQMRAQPATTATPMPGATSPTPTPVPASATPVPPSATPTSLPPSATPTSPPLPDNWLARLNVYRTAAGLPAVQEDPALSAADALHVQYMLLNPSEFQHNETPGLPGFTADGQRAAQQSNLFRGQVGFTAANAIDGWMDDMPHRFGMLNAPLTHTGFALACNSAGCATALNVLAALDGADRAGGTVYPGAGQQGVQTNLITWQFGPFEPPVMLVNATVTDEHGAAVSITTTPANGYFNAVSIQPAHPFAAATAYTVDANVTVNGQPYHKTWSFRTP